MIETSSVSPRISSEIFGNLRKIYEKCSETFALPSEQFWKIFGNFRKVVGNLRKNYVPLVCLCNKQNITCPLVDMNFIFSCSTRHFEFTRSLRSLVRYRVEHSKIKFISTRGHVISSIYLFLWSWAGGILKILQSDWFRERAVFSYLLTTVMVTNYAKRRVKLRIERTKFQFVVIVFCNRAVLLFNFLKKIQWIQTKAITVKANFITQTKSIKRTTQCVCSFDS